MSRDYLNKDSAKSGLWFGYLSTSNSSERFHPHFREQRQGITYVTDLQYYFPKIFSFFFRIKLPMHFKSREHTKYQNVSAVMKVRKIICAYGLALISKLSRSWNWTCILKEQNHFLSCICCTWKEFFLLNYRTGRHFQIRTPWNIYKLEHE